MVDCTERICVIGAGCSGLTTIKRLKDYQLAYDCFDASDNIGGNWYFRNPNGLSACYDSLHIDTSKSRLAFEEFPVPADFPDFPHHGQILAYLNAYCDHFGLRDSITFNCKVMRAHREPDGIWRITLSTGETRTYRALIVCNGHHWSPHIPNEYPGEFAGLQMHAHSYRSPFEPHDLRGKNILVVGAGNSAMDIASELSQRPIAKSLHVSMRRGVYVFPKYIGGKPVDKATLPSWVPLKLGRWLAAQVLKRAVGRMEDYGLPTPDHKPLEAHPSVSGDFLNRLGSGDIKIKPGIKHFVSDGVVFSDGSRIQADAIIYATGYKIAFPFFDQAAFLPHDNQLPLFKRMMLPGVDNLFFMGLAQALPTLLNLAEQQSKLVAALLAGDYTPPSPADMQAIIAADAARHAGHYYASQRHTIQVDFAPYVKDLTQEIARGKIRLRRAA